MLIIYFIIIYLLLVRLGFVVHCTYRGKTYKAKSSRLYSFKFSCNGTELIDCWW